MRGQPPGAPPGPVHQRAPFGQAPDEPAQTRYFFSLVPLAGLSAVALRPKLPYPVLLTAAGGPVALRPLPAVVFPPFLPPLLREA